MRFYIVTISILIFVSFSHFTIQKSNLEDRNGLSDQIDSSFKVYKIDSINNYYLVYAKRHDSLFKIVSEKAINTNCEKIRVDNNYIMSLASIWTKPIMMGNLNVSPSMTPHVTCLGFDDSTSICIDRANGIYDLFTCDNLVGLGYLSKK